MSSGPTKKTCWQAGPWDPTLSPWFQMKFVYIIIIILSIQFSSHVNTIRHPLTIWWVLANCSFAAVACYSGSQDLVGIPFDHLPLLAAKNYCRRLGAPKHFGTWPHAFPNGFFLDSKLGPVTFGHFWKYMKLIWVLKIGSNRRMLFDQKKNRRMLIIPQW